MITRSPHRQAPCGRLASHHRRGFTLIEVLIVLLLFSVGLLGLVGLQAKAMQISVGGEDSARASLLANDAASAMWGLNSVTLPAGALASWKARVADPTVAGLPNGVGDVTVSDNVATITVTWRAPHEASTESHRYVTQVLIPVAIAASGP